VDANAIGCLSFGLEGKTLEQRLRLIDDRFEIYDLIARHHVGIRRQ